MQKWTERESPYRSTFVRLMQKGGSEEPPSMLRRFTLLRFTPASSGRYVHR